MISKSGGCLNCMSVHTRAKHPIQDYLTPMHLWSQLIWLNYRVQHIHICCQLAGEIWPFYRGYERFTVWKQQFVIQTSTYTYNVTYIAIILVKVMNEFTKKKKNYNHCLRYVMVKNSFLSFKCHFRLGVALMNIHCMYIIPVDHQCSSFKLRKSVKAIIQINACKLYNIYNT